MMKIVGCDKLIAVQQWWKSYKQIVGELKTLKRRNEMKPKRFGSIQAVQMSGAILKSTRATDGFG